MALSLSWWLVALMAMACQARTGGKGLHPILGWNTWFVPGLVCRLPPITQTTHDEQHRCTQNSCGVDWCSSAEVLDVAAYIKNSGMLDIGYDHINLDDCTLYSGLLEAGLSLDVFLFLFRLGCPRQCNKQDYG